MIKVHDRHFELYMPESEIQQCVKRVAAEISRDLTDKDPLFCPTLTGSFMFMSDLAASLDFDAEVCFVKYTSYQGMNSTGVVRSQLPFTEKCRGRNVVIVEDIIDSGTTIEFMIDELKKFNPAGIYIATFLFKPGNFKKNFKIDYIGRSIPDDFILGYGMDYNEKGRFYKDIYVVNCEW